MYNIILFEHGTNFYNNPKIQQRINVKTHQVLMDTQDPKKIVCLFVKMYAALHMNNALLPLFHGFDKFLFFVIFSFNCEVLSKDNLVFIYMNGNQFMQRRFL